MRPLCEGKMTRLNVAMPVELKRRLVVQAAKESIEGDTQATPSSVARRAVEEYLERCETKEAK